MTEEEKSSLTCQQLSFMKRLGIIEKEGKKSQMQGKGTIIALHALSILQYV